MDLGLSLNETTVTDFILLGFGVERQVRVFLLIFFAILYTLTLAENFTIITLVFLDTRLSRLPMYILLSNFSWLEMCYVSATMPRMLFDLTYPQGTISFHSCFLQFYIFFSLGSTECFFLSTMSLDRYLAICHPLRYPQIMSPDTCYVLVAACWVLGFLWFVIPVILMSELSFCGPRIINHFLCDPEPILSLACPPLGIAPQVHRMFGNVLLLGNLSFVLLSYGVVILSLMKSSVQGSLKKSFSTLSFHLLVVTLFYGSVAAMYLAPSGRNLSETAKVVTVFYTTVTPFLNPMIYCLRNDQVREAFGRLWQRKLKLLRSKVTT